MTPVSATATATATAAVAVMTPATVTVTTAVTVITWRWQPVHAIQTGDAQFGMQVLWCFHLALPLAHHVHQHAHHRPGMREVLHLLKR
jgi:hypothetical protein